MKIYAHRGSSGTHPENTIAAFLDAAKLPIHGIELDVHMTKDGELVVIHDEKIDRTSNGKGFVQDMTLAELRNYDFGSWFSFKFKGELIPTLYEVLEIYLGTTHHLNIELKSDVINYPGMTEKVLDLVGNLNLDTRVVISSFNLDAIRTVKELAPHIETGALFMKPLKNPLDYVRSIPADALHIKARAALRPSMRQVINEGVIVRVFTINTIKYLSALKEIGVDAIFTDYPERLYEYMANNKN
ncbi:glycerophosphodiester phosphodiesterase [Sporosarcina sp. Marseille-Q4063]|uniref:glycerophosphodiester phosphodiesterase n=1 Tax=Sporosarcina sp. Marseille-Q4063 TaxID=2810514 RepID=UPI001BAEF794|nr:glycerophosphodiester phosphodiesterase [Sporosarcina sp. Marseille-Q4063]QUW22048.1 glycerophosphodiester phosphodiesterase [Sporosarcina sp. Marseille-Q4063]